MIICPKCGNQNPLGRVFCGACGNKLDLNHMSSDHVATMTRKSTISLAWLRFLPLLLLPVIVMVAMALWPDTEIIGKKGTLLGGQRVQSALNGLANVGKGRTLGRDFTEEDINGYFEFIKTPALKVRSVSIQTGEGYFRLHVVRNLTAMQLGSVVIEPAVSYDLYCSPAGGMLRVLKVRMGRLGWLGPMKTSVIRKVYAMLSAQPEWATFGNVSEIRASAGKIAVTVQKN